MLSDIKDRSTAIEYADKSRQRLSPSLDPKRRSELGQYMTPAPVARFMASLFDDLPKRVRLLDAGAGVGSLTGAFVREVCNRAKRPEKIDVVAFEVDGELAKHLAETLELCAAECRTNGIKFRSRIVPDDYILQASEPLLSEYAGETLFNCAILNPPYAKINASSKTRRALRRLGIETSNLYTAFVAVALKQLEPGGQLVAITPRSFCNGSYFEPFRRFVLESSAIRSIHVYESRKRAFADDDVLQENIIYKLVRSDQQPATVWLSHSSGPSDAAIKGRFVPFSEVVVPSDPHRFIRISVNHEDSDLAERVRALPCTLRELRIGVSTGRVVDFRAREHLRKDPDENSVPLIYPAHFENGFVAWPKLGSRKHNALAQNYETSSLTVPKGAYVLTKRFSSKEERRRLVAVVYDPERISAECVGFENHLNYFHRNGTGLPIELAKGLALFLNSTAVDQYFRQFSGHTQVNATDLRNLHYPAEKELVRLGAYYAAAVLSQDEIDGLVEPLLGLSRE